MLSRMRVCPIHDIDGEEDVACEAEFYFTNVEKVPRKGGAQYFYDECWFKLRREDTYRIVAQIWPGEPTVNAKLSFDILNSYEADFFEKYLEDMERNR